MDQDFKVKLLALYPAFNRVTGPYLRPDGRKHVCFNNTMLPSGDPLKKKSLSWPKALIEVREGRILIGNETADHIDEDFTNDNLSNLQILTRPANILKSFEANPSRAEELIKCVCLECSNDFVMLARQFNGNQIAKGKVGPFCSRRCAGKYNQRVQMSYRNSPA